jgi:hypothetical protein
VLRRNGRTRAEARIRLFRRVAGTALGGEAAIKKGQKSAKLTKERLPRGRGGDVKTLWDDKVAQYNNA